MPKEQESLADRYLKMDPEEAYKLINQEINDLLRETRTHSGLFQRVYRLAEIVRFLGFMSQVQYREIEVLKKHFLANGEEGER